ncbi:hypothetical protein PENTCL1PPCAC_15576, partial [Pristionchus entomophagus]
PELEALAYLSAMIAPTISPAVTIWYLAPYRRYVILSILHLHTTMKIGILPRQATLTMTKIDIA